MRTHVLPVRPARADLVDTAGTGGDGARTLNISTTSALVAAAAGAAVAKHGNRAVSSSSGSADLLEALGFDLDMAPERIATSIDTLGFGFMFAPRHHPAMKHAAPVRRELGIRTVFNLLGPLTNPAGARRQVIGVYAPELVPLMASVLVELGVDRALVAHGAGDIDELTTLGVNRARLVEGAEVRDFDVDPAELGLVQGTMADLAGGTGADNARRAREILAGARGAAADTVVLNAGATLFVAGRAATLEEGCALARAAIDDGAAGRRLDELIAFSRAEEATAPTTAGGRRAR
jgi:anthranilate phosphoribosyltransferase